MKILIKYMKSLSAPILSLFMIVTVAYAATYILSENKEVYITGGGLHLDGDLHLRDTLKVGNLTEVTIASGVITVSETVHYVDTEADGASDDLDTINGGVEGDILILSAINNSRTVVVKDATGNIQLAGDMSLTHSADKIMLIYRGTNWEEISRADNTT